MYLDKICLKWIIIDFQNMERSHWWEIWQCCPTPFWKESHFLKKLFSTKKKGCLFHSHFKKKPISLFKKGYLNHRKKAFLHNKKRFSREKKVIKKKERNAFLHTAHFRGDNFPLIWRQFGSALFSVKAIFQCSIFLHF